MTNQPQDKCCHKCIGPEAKVGDMELTCKYGGNCPCHSPQDSKSKEWKGIPENVVREAVRQSNEDQKKLFDSPERDWEKEFDVKYMLNERLCCNGDYCGANCAEKMGSEIKSFISNLLFQERERVRGIIEDAKAAGVEEVSILWLEDTLLSSLTKEEIE